MATKRQKVRLTCQCGVPYTLDTVADFPTRCINERCRSTLHMSMSEFQEYKRSLRVLIEALEGGRDYREAVKTVNRVSRGKSPYSIDIVEIPTVDCDGIDCLAG